MNIVSILRKINQIFPAFCSRIIYILLLIFSATLEVKSEGRGAEINIYRIGDVTLRFPFLIKEDRVSLKDFSKSKNNVPYQNSISNNKNINIVDLQSAIIQLNNIVSYVERGPIVVITAHERASEYDLYCKSKNRYYDIMRLPSIGSNDPDFFIFREKMAGGDVFISKNRISAFGAPLTAWRLLLPSLKVPGSLVESFYLSIALTKRVSISLRVSTDYISRQQIFNLIGEIEKAIPQWLVEPSKADFRWFHNTSSCS